MSLPTYEPTQPQCAHRTFQLLDGKRRILQRQLRKPGKMRRVCSHGGRHLVVVGATEREPVRRGLPVEVRERVGREHLVVDAEFAHQLQTPVEIRERRIDELHVFQDVVARAKKLDAVAQSHLGARAAALAHDRRKEDMGVNVDRSCGHSIPRRGLLRQSGRAAPTD
jgi:hypothetical protein